MKYESMGFVAMSDTFIISTIQPSKEDVRKIWPISWHPAWKIVEVFKKVEDEKDDKDGSR